MLGFGVILPHLAYYAEELGASATQIGFLIGIYSAMQLILAPMWGRLSDQYGRRPVILMGLVGNTGALVLFGAAKSLLWLFIARGLAGVFSAAILPTVMAYVADVTTEEDRGKGMGLMGAAMGLGFIFGPGIGGIIGSHNLPFFLAGGLSLATFCFALLLLPESLKLTELPDTHESNYLSLVSNKSPTDAALSRCFFLSVHLFRTGDYFSTVHQRSTELRGKRDGSDVRDYGDTRCSTTGWCFR